MEKRSALPIILILSIFLIPLVSAGFWEEFLQSTEFWSVATFLFFFAVVYFALKKILFGEEKFIATVVAMIVAFFITGFFVAYAQEMLMQYDIAKYIFFGVVILGLVVISQRIFNLFSGKEAMNKLKWLAGTLFIVYLVYLFNPFNLAFIVEIKESIPSNIKGVITVLGVLCGAIMAIGIIRIILNLLSGEERKLLLEGWKEKKKTKREQAEILKREKKADFQEKKRRADEEGTRKQRMGLERAATLLEARRLSHAGKKKPAPKPKSEVEGYGKYETG